jgi:hypothetical protein
VIIILDEFFSAYIIEIIYQHKLYVDRAVLIISLFVIKRESYWMLKKMHRSTYLSRKTLLILEETLF